MGGQTNRKLGARLALFVTSGLLSLLVAEWGARVAFPNQRSIAFYDYDDRYDFRHRAGHDRVTSDFGEGRPWRFVTNERGFRGAAWSPKPKGNRLRAYVAGDSFTFGNAVATNEAFPSVADAQNRNWEIINLGTSSWGPANALAYLETEGADLEGSCLVYALFHGNDVTDGLRRTLYRLDESGAAVRVEPKKRAPTKSSNLRALARMLPLYDFLLENSQLMNLVRSAAIMLVVQADEAELLRGAINR